MKLTRRTVLLTGGGTGLGRALAKQLADRDNTVLICGRRRGLLEETASASENIHPYRCDLTMADELEGMLDAIVRDGRQVDTLISNAAISGFHSLARGQDRVWIGESKMFRFLQLVLPPGRLFNVVNDWTPRERD